LCGESERILAHSGHSTSAMPLSRKRFDSIEITPESEHLSVLAVCTWSPTGSRLPHAQFVSDRVCSDACQGMHLQTRRHSRDPDQQGRCQEQVPGSRAEASVLEVGRGSVQKSITAYPCSRKCSLVEADVVGDFSFPLL